MRCHYRIFNTRNNWQLCMWSVSFIFLTDMFSLCCQKCGPGPKLFPRLDIFSTFRGIHKLIFTYVPYIVIGLHEEPANFYREKRSVAFVTSHLFTSQVVLSLIWLVTTQILICENQTIWRLKILLRTIVAALLKTKCNGRFVKYKRYPETGKEYFRIVWMTWKMRVTYILLLEQHLMPDHAHPAHPPPHKFGTQTNRMGAVCLMTSAHPTSSPHNLISNSHNCPKRKENLFQKSWNFT